MNLIHNERIKLTAVWLNTLAAATLATGVIAPIAAIVFGLPTSATLSRVGLALAMWGWFSLGFGLHWLARYILGRLRE